MELKSFLLALLTTVAAADGNGMFMTRTSQQDQAASSSGYAYRTDSNGPTSYMEYNSGTGNNFGYPPITFGHYTKAPIPYVHYPHTAQLLNPAGEIYDAGNKNYANEHGKKYEEQQHSNEGEKGASGYNKQASFAKGAKGEHEKEGQAGYFKKEGGSKAGDHEESGHYAAGHEAAAGKEGGSSSENSSHKKGSKTTGYHKVYHKDEYKKDHTFYDESNSSGHQDKYGDGHAEHSSTKGGYKKGGKEQAAHQAGKYGKKGYYDKGHYNADDRGYKGEEGDRKYYNNHSDYAKDGGAENEESYGNEEESGEHY